MKRALHETVKAAAFDREKALEEMLIDGQRSDRTKRAYRDELRKLFSLVDREGLPLLALTRADCNRFRDELLRRYSPNSVRLTLAAASALWKYMELTRVIQTNPFAALALPRREYKHRIEPNQGAPIPVMNDEDARVILEALEDMCRAKGKDIATRKAKGSAKALLPLVRTLGETSLRLGDALSLQMEDDRKASVRVKGGRVRSAALPENLAKAFKGTRRPFSGLKTRAVQAALRRLMLKFAAEGEIGRLDIPTHLMTTATALLLTFIIQRTTYLPSRENSVTRAWR